MSEQDEDDRIEALEERLEILEDALRKIGSTAKVAHTWASYALDQQRAAQGASISQRYER